MLEDEFPGIPLTMVQRNVQWTKLKLYTTLSTDFKSGLKGNPWPTGQ